MRKILCVGPKHFDQLTVRTRPDLQLCAAVTTLKMAGNAIVTFMFMAQLWRRCCLMLQYSKVSDVQPCKVIKNWVQKSCLL